MKHELHIAVKDLKLMMEVIETLPKNDIVDSVMITYENTGIGYNLFVTKHITINGIHGDFKTEISDPAEW